MATMKTAVSLDKSLFEKAERAAHQMQVTRSQLYAQALGEYLRKRDSEELLASWNAAYADELDAEEKEHLREIEMLHWELLEDEEW